MRRQNAYSCAGLLISDIKRWKAFKLSAQDWWIAGQAVQPFPLWCSCRSAALISGQVGLSLHLFFVFMFLIRYSTWQIIISPLASLRLFYQTGSANVGSLSCLCWIWPKTCQTGLCQQMRQHCSTRTNDAEAFRVFGNVRQWKEWKV